MEKFTFISLDVVVTAIGGLLVTLYEDKRQRRLRYFGAALIFIGIFGTAYKQYRSEQKIQDLNTQILASITGGESFCYVSPPRGPADRDSYDLYVTHNGDHPLYDVSVQIQDMSQVKAIIQDAKNNKGSLEGILKATSVISVGNIIPASALMIGSIKLPKNIEVFEFRIKIIARNGFFDQILKCRRGRKNMFFATKVTRDSDKKILHEFIHPEFPRNSAGGIDWQ